jgi:hypothetical protein
MLRLEGEETGTSKLPPRRYADGGNFEELKQELQMIIEKERILTDEIIKNSLVKQNGKFNYEALAHLNEIIQSKKDLKRKFAVVNAPTKQYDE